MISKKLTLSFCLSAILVAPVNDASAQVLPPPSLPGQDRIAEKLIQAIESKDAEIYFSLLSDSVMVTQDGREIAANKSAWMQAFRPKLEAKGVEFNVVKGYSSTGRILLIEHFNSAASWGTSVPAHCCWSYDAVAYDIEGDTIRAITRLRGGDVQLPHEARTEQ